jgi:cytochrome c oxidase subunit 1
MATYSPARHHDHGHGHHGPGRKLSYWWKRGFAWAFGGVLFGYLLVVTIRAIAGMEPLYNEQVSVTAATIFGVMGFLIGMGCFDYWWTWIRGRRLPEEDHSMHGARSWKDYFRVNTDHKVIGVQYLVVVFFFFFVGGGLAEAFRAELQKPGEQFFDGETFNGLFSLHATLMIFLFVIPAFAGLANFILPIMIGAKDMAFPRLNALSIWMLPPAGFLMLASLPVGMFSSGWTAYVPLAVQKGTGQTLFEVGVQFAGASSIMTAVNFLVTIITMRAPGMTVWRMPLLVWANATTSALVVFGTPFIAGSQFLTMFDRIMGTRFFDPANGGDVISYQHIFWFYSHPAVYIMMLPGFGIVSEVIATFSRKPIFGYRAIAFSTVAIAVLGFSVWAHHMFVSGMADWLRAPMMLTTLIIAVPTGIKIFSWLGTLWQGRIHLKTPMLFILGFLFTFVIGGLSGIYLGSVPIDINTSDTYFVVAHIHYVLFGGSVFTIFAGVYYWFPKMTGKMYNERLGKLHFWITFITFNLTFFPMHWLGLQDMPRRVADYSERYAGLNEAISIASYFLGAGMLIFLYNMIVSWRRGEPAPWNPWRGRTLEWLVSSPPSLFNFDETPQVVGGPYQYGIPGARHAVVFAAPEAGGGELREGQRRPILVIANQTATGRALVEELRGRAEDGYWRFRIVAPLDEQGEDGRRAAERRLEVALAMLSELGVEAAGEVVEGDPVEAALRALEQEPATTIIVASYPTEESRWMRQDVIDRLRKATGLPVTHVVVTRAEARQPVAGYSKVRHVLVVGNETIGEEALVDELLRRADRGPVRYTVLCPLNLSGPDWKEDAVEARRAAVARVRRMIDLLQDSGIHAEGEVVDGPPLDEIRSALGRFRPDEVLISTFPRRESAWLAEDLIHRVRAMAEVPVEHIIVEAETPAGSSGS